MPIRKTLKRGRTRVPTFRQENKKFCGPASAKMVLRWLKVKRSQTQLWDVLQDAADTLGLPLCESCTGSEQLCEPWSTNPEALADVLHGLGKAPIKLISERSAAATDHAIVWSLINDIPAVALVQGWAHWLVVHGYHVDREPANIDDTGYQLLGFDVIDPWPTTPARVFVDAAEWRSDYLNGVPCGRFTGSFVAVCDPEPTRPKGGPTVPARRTEWQGSERDGRKGRKAGGVRMLPVERARNAAIAGIERAGLMKDVVWRTAMRGTTPGTPQLVHRLDRPRQLYMVVPFEKAKATTAQVLVDAYSGAMLTARATENVKRTLATPWSMEDALDRVARRRWDLPGARANMQVRREALSASTTLVWKPCTESLSPFMPFTRVSYGDFAFYVRSDGEVFTELTRPSPGG